MPTQPVHDSSPKLCSGSPLPGPLRVRIRVRGVVQGVGYRPFVFRLAEEEHLAGWVSNDSEGVLAEVEGIPDDVERFVARLRVEQPPLARVDAVERVTAEPDGKSGFTIHASARGAEAHTGIPPDAATCPDCLRELLDRGDRRYEYPFLNCTHCGPRFTLTRSIPYDRPQTSMARFPLCPSCQREYEDPRDRRFHAQPNACAVCGPRLEFVDAQGNPCHESPLEETIRRLCRGEIIAIKGVGGFHLAADAGNDEAVRRLRERKHRLAKPLAVMVKDADAATALCTLNAAERELLTGIERPIVLLRRRDIVESAAGAPRVAVSVAAGVSRLGLFLPYAPLHHLLFADGRIDALVMTSANLADEPICIDNDEARERLRAIADGYLIHDREILQRCDDSVMTVVEGFPQIVRRARGYVPLSVPLPMAAPPLLAVGGQMKCAFTLARGTEAIQSQHLGDLENRAGLEFFERALVHLQRTFDVQPEYVVHDLHPEYLSTQWAASFARKRNLPLIAVQHHHAHVAACMAEHGVVQPVIGVALDGTGLGTDGTIWGGEVMIADLCGFRRTGHLRGVPMPGGAKAIEQPWRMALSAVYTLLGEEAARELSWPGCDTELMLKWMEQGTVGPLTTSCGRWFDAAAALVMGRAVTAYEAQAAIEFEDMAEESDCDSYTCVVGTDQEGAVIEPETMLRELLRERQAGVSAAVMSARFHAWLARSFVEVARRTRTTSALNRVCLSGGCMHNRLLTRLLKRKLESDGFEVLLHRAVSPGDGGLSYGQAAAAAAQIGSRSTASGRFI